MSGPRDTSAAGLMVPATEAGGAGLKTHGQYTARSVLDVLQWIEAVPHHQAAWRTKDGRGYADHDDPNAFMELSGQGAKLRIPVSIQEQTRDLIQPGDQFDTRMFRANEAGRAAIAKALTPASGRGNETRSQSQPGYDGGSAASANSEPSAPRSYGASVNGGE